MTIGRARIVKSIAGALLLSLGVRYLWRNLYDVTSSYAVVSADSFSVASPIDGFVTYSNTAIGTIFASGQTLLQVDNTLVDKTQVAELEAQVVALDGEIEALRSIIGKLEGLGGQFSRRNRVYEERRGEQLAVLVSRAEAQVDADQAKYNEAQTRRSRAAKLAAAGVEPLQKSEEAERDVVVAGGRVHLHRHRHQAEADHTGPHRTRHGLSSTQPGARLPATKRRTSPEWDAHRFAGSSQAALSAIR